MNFDEIKLLLLDVDGVLTDGSIIISDEGEIKRFNVQDGLGIGLARRAGIKVFFITNRDSKPVRQRAKELRIDGAFFGISNKTKVLEKILVDEGVDEREVAYIGDDLIDLPVMQQVGCPVAVANAVAEVKEVACYVTKISGGQGAVREAIEWILKQNDKWDEIIAAYLNEHGASWHDRTI